VHIQATHQDLPIESRTLISRDIMSLQAMTTSALTSYLYGVQEVIEASRQHRHRETGQEQIQQFFQPRQGNGNEHSN
jgi:hypothetical protein